MQLAGPYSSAFLNMQLAGKAMLRRDPAYPCDADSAVVVHPKHFHNTHMAPMNFKLVSIWSDSDRIETELEIRRGPITQPNAPYLAASCCSAQTMSVREQSVLQCAWSQAPRGRLSPWMEAKAWGSLIRSFSLSLSLSHSIFLSLLLVPFPSPSPCVHAPMSSAWHDARAGIASK